MAGIDFVISNDRHHPMMFRPVARRLAEQGHRVRVLSFCEWRGLRTPLEALQSSGLEVMRMLPVMVRPSPALATGNTASPDGAARRTIKWAVWEVLFARRLRGALGETALVVVPNDAVFPYDRLCPWLTSMGIPFLLVQEGIRFPLPGSWSRPYGRGGAAAVAAWGESSAAYFRAQGVPEDRIYLTGNPRFDDLRVTDWNAQGARLAQRHGLGGNNNLLFLPNPIEGQGLASAAAKMGLVSRFLTDVAPLLDDQDLTLIIKPHAGESTRDYRDVVGRLGSTRVRLLPEAPLYPLLTMVRAVVILASTAGLEAMLFGVPVGVLEIPGAGFAYDYVAGGAASGLAWAGPSMADQVRALLQRDPERERLARAYVARALATQDDATGRIATLIGRLARGRTAVGAAPAPRLEGSR